MKKATLRKNGGNISLKIYRFMMPAGFIDFTVSYFRYSPSDCPLIACRTEEPGAKGFSCQVSVFRISVVDSATWTLKTFLHKFPLPDQTGCL
jgi:hypothetical protein